MKVLLALALTSLVSAAMAKPMAIDTDRFSILSNSPLPAKFSIKVNKENIFDECIDVPEHVVIDRDVHTIDMDLTAVFEAEKLQIEIIDRGADCLGETVYFVSKEVDHEFYVNKWNGTTMLARMNNFPRRVEEIELPEITL